MCSVLCYELQTQLLSNGKTANGELSIYPDASELIESKDCNGKVHSNAVVVSC